MIGKKSGNILAAVVTLMSFLTIAYLSCTKPGANLNTCEGVICENTGYCHIDTVTNKARCFCPTGYEGNNCAVVSTAKYIGTWDATQIIIGSDSVGFVGDTSYYTLFFANSSTPTTFFIDNFANNPYYNILCTLDSGNSYSFTMDTASAYHMLFNNYKLLYGSGSISSNSSIIVATFASRHLSTTTNWINDTMLLTMKPHVY